MTTRGTKASAEAGAGQVGAGGLRPGGTAAFFDVDETLLTTKSMAAFWDHWAPTRRGELEALLAGGLPRTERNRAYYRLFAGVRPQQLQRAGAEWYDAYRRGPRAFVPATVDALRRHQRAGHGIVLVSGSCHALLDPLGEELGADLVLCTEQEIAADGLFTGEVAEPMIGQAKAEAVLRTIAARELVAADCHAYGDDVSDLPMLRVVGQAVAVGGRRELAEEAHRLGWRMLPAA
ncbi:HAD-IB family hydrolase [Kitasatospora atroaurantiaca]|uniref:HAD superfamily hydrolase (TIGR01490 family) n=1 Tax=Kitasatospora atroaurantiaca TaxID=285545 RepID=A0A561ET71_9ACTN|nr:HAD-IB family hydrolase [Kitasatospora atroaurantiaca]TWE18814.1 HAD superfamily hydrolase (TIGR01490 family) [Kitasatospora atroaurantiaca]